MFCVGENVVYGMHGVCAVSGIESRNIENRTVEYYVLEPLSQPGTRYYVPAHNPTALAKIRNLISRDELNELLNSQAVRRNCWIEDENRRKLRYRELITSGDRGAILQMIFTLHVHKNELQQTGRKFHLCDENFLSDAQKLLSDEFSCVLDMPAQNVEKYIVERFEK